MVTIYFLRDPRLPGIIGVRYIGKTNSSLRQRLRQHLKDSRRRSYKVCGWIQSLLQKGVRPEIVRLDRVSRTAWRIAEKGWIARYLLAGANLCNLQDGGLGPYGHVDETRAKLSQAHKGRTRSLESRLRQSAAQRGRIQTPETRTKIAASLRGRPSPPEKGLRISAALTGRKGRPLSKEHIAKLLAGQRAKIWTPEDSARHSAALRGRKMPPRSAEHRAKLAEANRGKSISPEMRAKIAVTLRKRYSTPEGRAQILRVARMGTEARWGKLRE